MCKGSVVKGKKKSGRKGRGRDMGTVQAVMSAFHHTLNLHSELLEWKKSLRGGEKKGKRGRKRYLLTQQRTSLKTHINFLFLSSTC